MTVASSTLRVTATAAAELRAAFVSTFSLARLTAVTALAGTVILELQAMANGYGLRVTSDTPTYLALLRTVALHPLASVSPFLSVSGVESSHATPDMEILALVWRAISPTRSLVDPVAAYHLLALWGIVVTLLVAHALFLWVRGLAGSTAGWLSIPLLLGLFGPADVIWAGDLSFHGLLYGSYFSQTFAVALLLYALRFVPRASTRRAQAAAVLLVTLLFLVHPFTGVLFVFLASCQAAGWAWQRKPGWRRAPAITAVAFVLGCTWPAYALSPAMAVSGIGGWALIGLAALFPLAAFRAGKVARARRLVERLPRLRLGLTRSRVALALALSGVLIVCLVAGWEEWLATRPITDPLRPTNHLAVYWDDRLIRWPLLLGAGLVGVSGLAYLSRSKSRLPAFWFGVCFCAGLAGAAGLPIPLWNRLLLFCQLPLAAGTAVVLTRARLSIKAIVVAGFVASAVFRICFLYYAPATVTYYPQFWVPAGYSLGSQIAPGTFGVVAADPYTSYYIPGATGHPTLLISKSHVGSEPELAAATEGYALLHQLYVGRAWQQSARELWRRGVRYVVVDHRITLADPTLAQFSGDPNPLWQTEAQRRQLGAYFHRLNLLGHVVADTPQYAVYRLDSAKVRWELGV